MVLFAGALLLTPGFFTDAVGFALLVPGVQKRLFKELRSRVHVQTVGPRGPRPTRQRSDGTVIEGEAHEVEITEPDPTRRPSGWTRASGDDRSRPD